MTKWQAQRLGPKYVALSQSSRVALVYRVGPLPQGEISEHPASSTDAKLKFV